MRLLVLGSGSSGNCYLLQGEKETLIIECGLPYKTILKGLNFNLNNVVGCLVSHEHKDHSKAINDLNINGINVYSSKGTFETLGITHHRAIGIESEVAFKIGEFVIVPFKTEHDATEPLGFLINHSEIGNLLFITDSYYCRYKFPGINHILIECNYSNEILKENMEQGKIPLTLRNRLIKSHFELSNVKEFLKANDLSNIENILLIHLSDSNSNATQFKKEIEKLANKNVSVADAGVVIELGVV